MAALQWQPVTASKAHLSVYHWFLCPVMPTGFWLAGLFYPPSPTAGFCSLADERHSVSTWKITCWLTEGKPENKYFSSGFCVFFWPKPQVNCFSLMHCKKCSLVAKLNSRRVYLFLKVITQWEQDDMMWISNTNMQMIQAANLFCTHRAQCKYAFMSQVEI